MSFEDASSELEATVRRLEEGDSNLEESIALYERGMLLAQHCSNLLDQAELQVSELTISGSQQGEEL
jgi:exodeoxyribonuclease VII small subunit